MKDEVLQFKNFLYKERKTEDEKRELHRDLEHLTRWGNLMIIYANNKIKAIRITLEIRFNEDEMGE